ncbi:YceI family protein [uncultured Photobacterium sp.]|uniref:YceI family protein n=1 Tax=uncultured Photobacterium sp. TaxID=173973 RepID=UPI002636A2D2|nr:YceI family protein [uncultured Photobacterium sp.]
MHVSYRLLRVCSLIFVLGLGVNVSALADWRLDNTQSTINFSTVKNGSVIEYHHFGNIGGSITKGGEVSITIDLTSVDTKIPIRDERMKKELFVTERFPLTILSSKVDSVMLSDMIPGKTKLLDVDFTLDLHGIKQQLAAKLQVTGLENGGLLISTTWPVDVSAEKFGLDKGIEILRDIAKLNSILLRVPVNAQLIFVK